jgi:hypothetical protein
MTTINEVLRARPGASLALAGAIMVIALTLFNQQARADGLYPPPPPPLAAIPLPPPVVQLPPSESCIETAIQLGYQTGNPRVGQAAAEACRIYAPVRFPGRYYGPPALGGYPPPR